MTLKYHHWPVQVAIRPGHMCKWSMCACWLLICHDGAIKWLFSLLMVWVSFCCRQLFFSKFWLTLRHLTIRTPHSHKATCIYHHQKNTTVCNKLLKCKYGVCANGWKDTPPAHVAKGEATTCASGVFVPTDDRETPPPYVVLLAVVVPGSNFWCGSYKIIQHSTCNQGFVQRTINCLCSEWSVATTDVYNSLQRYPVILKDIKNACWSSGPECLWD